MARLFLHALLICLLSVVSQTNGMAQGSPIRLEVMLTPPYPLRVSDYQNLGDNILVNISTTPDAQPGKTYQIFLKIDINGTSGAFARTKAGYLPPTAISITTGQVIPLTGNDLDAFRRGLTSGDFDYGGFNTSVAQADQVLPEGEYSICLQAFDYTSPAAGPLSEQTCAVFPVIYANQPQLINHCPIEAEPSEQILSLSWFQIGVPAGTNVDYVVRVWPYELGGTNANIPQLVNSTVPITFDVPPGMLNYVFDFSIAQGGMAWNPGWSYLIQIQARSTEIGFEGQGLSDYCWVTFGTSVSNIPSLQPVYPYSGDFIPFQKFPVVVRLTPYDVHYSNFEYSSEIRSYATGETVDNFSGTNAWNPDPIRGQQLNTRFQNKPTPWLEQRSTYLPVYKAPEQNPITLERGTQYQVRASGSVRKDNNASFPLETDDVDFNFGMAPVTPVAPANEIVLPLGSQVGFRFKPPVPHSFFAEMESGEILQGLYRMRGQESWTFQYGPVQECWLLEVARDNDFNQRIYGEIKCFSESAIAVTYPNGPTDAEWEAKKNAIWGEKASSQSVHADQRGDYYWKVSWLKNQSDGPESGQSRLLNSEIPNIPGGVYNQSPVYKFSVGTGSTNPDDPDRIAACIATCNAEPVPESEKESLTTFQADDEVIVGKFTMKIKEIQFQNNAGHGTGEIRVQFLNNARIKVAFDGLKINAANRVWAGTVKAVEDMPEIIPGNIAQRGLSAAGLSDTEAAAFDDAINQVTRTVMGLTGNDVIGMPLGFDVVVDSAANQKITIGIVSMDFSPVHATMGALFSVDFPELNGWLSLGARDICFYPSGLDLNQATLYSPIEKRIPFGDDITLVFPAANLTARDTGTYVAWDCRGFRKLVLSGYLEFSRNLLLPDTPNGTPATTGTVKARFKFTARNADNYMGKISMDDFQIKGLDGWGFTAQNVWLDFSSVENPSGIKFPSGYTGDRTAIWKGLMLGRASVRLPQEFRTSSNPNERLAIGIDSLLADRTGISMSVFVRNIINTGSVEGWKFTLDQFQLKIVSNSMAQGGFTGRIWLPVDNNTNLKYSALLHNSGNNNFGFEFRVQPSDRLHADLWGATLELAPTSVIGINLGNLTHIDRNRDHVVSEIDWKEGAYAMLNGRVSFGNIQNFNLNFAGMEFQDLGVYTWEPYFSCRHMGSASPEKQMAGFPVSISNFEFVNKSTPATFDINPNAPGNRIGFKFDLGVTIMEGNNIFQATTTLGILARVDFDLGAKKLNIDFGGVDFEKVDIQGSIGTVSIHGGLQLFQKDNVYGDGFKGWLDAVFKPTIELKAVAQFGHKDDFDYWMVDASAEFNPGITLFAGVALNGFCGGAWSNMNMLADSSALQTGIRVAGQTRPPAEQLRRPGTTGSGIQYIPTKGAFGFRAGLIFGPQAGQAYRAKVTFAANFNAQGNISMMTLDGEVVVMPSQNTGGGTSEPPVRGYLHAQYDFVASTFLADIQVLVNVKIGGQNIIRGVGKNGLAGRIEMFASPADWWLYINRPQSRGGIKVGIQGVQEVGFDFYMEIGSKTDPMPPIPAEIASHFSPGLRQIDPQLTSGGGFMFGSQTSFIITPRFLCFYAEFGLTIGFDMALKDASRASCSGMPEGQRIGINGWYATGQMYAKVYGGVGIDVDVFFCRHCKLEAFRVEAGAVLQAGLPNPTWLRGGVYGAYSVLNGLISGSVNFEFSVGDECVMPVDPMNGIPILNDIRPANGTQKVDCGTAPAASFNLKYAEPFTITERLGPNNTRLRTFQVLYDAPTLVNAENETAVPGKVIKSDDKRVLSFAPNEYLKPKTRFRFTVSAYVQELIDEVWKDFRMNGEAVRETRTTVFTTDELPDVIRHSDIAYSWPMDYHGRYLQESNGHNGFVFLNRAVPFVFDKPAPQGTAWEYFAQFSKSSFGEGPYNDPNKQERPLIHDGKTLRFEVPPLESDRYYNIRLMKRLRVQPVIGSNGTFDTYAPITSQNVGTQNRTENVLNHSDSTKVNVTTTSITQNAIVEGSDKELFYWGFVTDPKSSPQEKFGNLAVSNINGIPSTDNPTSGLSAEITMPFTDSREINGFTYEYPAGTSHWVAPMLSITSAWDNSWQQTASANIFDPGRSIWNSGIHVYEPFAGMSFAYQEKSSVWLRNEDKFKLLDLSGFVTSFQAIAFQSGLANRYGNNFSSLIQEIPSSQVWPALGVLINGSTVIGPLTRTVYQYNLHYTAPPSYDGISLWGGYFVAYDYRLSPPVTPASIGILSVDFSPPLFVPIFFPSYIFTDLVFHP